MKTLLFGLLLSLILPSIGYAQCPGILDLTGIRPIGTHQEITVSSTAVALTVPSSATAFTVRFALVSVKANPIVTLDTGVNPTATLGLLWQANEKIYVCQSSLAAFRAIRSASDAVIGVSYYGN